MEERELTDASARSPHECIMSSITGVMLMLSPAPKRTRAPTSWVMPRCGPRLSSGLGPMSRKPMSCSSNPVTMMGRGPKRSLRVRANGV